MFLCRCIINCGKEVIASQRLSLSSQCSGSGCKDHEWVLLKRCIGPHCGNLTIDVPFLKENLELMNLSARTYTPLLNRADIVFKENNFTAGVWYYVRLKVGKGNTSSTAYYRFMAAPPPTGGVCHVTPSSGLSLSTSFRITCSNWTADGPLMFKFQYQLENGFHGVAYHGRNNSISTLLPSGNPSSNYNEHVKATISSLYGSVKVHLDVQVLFYKTSKQFVSKDTKIQLIAFKLILCLSIEVRDIITCYQLYQDRYTVLIFNN